MAEIGPHDQWARVAADLRQYRQEQEDTWGNIDDATLGRYLAGEMTADERKRVEVALEQHPQLRDLVSLVGEVLSEPAEVAPTTPPPVIVPARDETPAVLPFAPVKKSSAKRSAFRPHHLAVLAAAACVMLAVALPPLLGWLRSPEHGAAPLQVAELSPAKGERGGIFPGGGVESVPPPMPITFTPAPGDQKTMVRGGPPPGQFMARKEAEQDDRQRAVEEGRLVPFSFDGAVVVTAAPMRDERRVLLDQWSYERNYQPTTAVRLGGSYSRYGDPVYAPAPPAMGSVARSDKGPAYPYTTPMFGQAYATPSPYLLAQVYSPYGSANVYQTYPAQGVFTSSFTEVYSGKALNDLLDYLKARQSKDGLPAKDLPASLLRHVNLTTADGGHPGVLKHASRLPWPEVLRDSGFDTERKRIEQLAAELAAQAKSDGRIQEPTVRELRQAVDGLQKRLTEQVNELTPTQYIESKRFLNNVGAGCKALERKDAANFFNQTYAAKGRTVAELVQYMTGKGLRFAPAAPGDETAYQGLYLALQATAKALPQKTKAPVPR